MFHIWGNWYEKRNADFVVWRVGDTVLGVWDLTIEPQHSLLATVMPWYYCLCSREGVLHLLDIVQAELARVLKLLRGGEEE